MAHKVKRSNGLADSGPLICFLARPAINPLDNTFG
jgi:hypothetical protein